MGMDIDSGHPVRIVVDDRVNGPDKGQLEIAYCLLLRIGRLSSGGNTANFSSFSEILKAAATSNRW